METSLITQHGADHIAKGSRPLVKETAEQAAVRSRSLTVVIPTGTIIQQRKDTVARVIILRDSEDGEK